MTSSISVSNKLLAGQSLIVPEAGYGTQVASKFRWLVILLGDSAL